MRKLILAALLLAMAPALAQDSGALAFLQQIYGQYEKTDDGVDIRSAGAAQRYFTPAVARLMEADAAEAVRNKQSGRLDFDPFIGGQFWAPTKVTLTVAPGPKADQATGTARYIVKGGTREVVVTLDLVKIPAGWRIADMRWVGEQGTLMNILSAKQ